MPETDSSCPRVAEFFAGIGLVREALEGVGFDVVWANDIEPSKMALYEANYGAEHFSLRDIRDVVGDDIPDVSLATASFPCTDLSLAGNRAGFAGEESSMFWEFARVLDEMGTRRPPLVLLENVPSFATSHGGNDFAQAIRKLNDLDYACGAFILDARWFLPQSRPRLFIVGSASGLPEPWTATDGTFAPVQQLFATHPEPDLVPLVVPMPDVAPPSLAETVERLSTDDARWWDTERVARFVESLSPIQTRRLERLRTGRSLRWTTAYRRTRHGRAVWEMRADEIAGCLRTARGGSSKQALVEAGGGNLRIRWMTAREYARLQGAPAYRLEGVRDTQALFGFGDAVCVPVVAWIGKHLLQPLAKAGPTRRTASGVAVG